MAALLVRDATTAAALRLQELAAIVPALVDVAEQATVEADRFREWCERVQKDPAAYWPPPTHERVK